MYIYKLLIFPAEFDHMLEVNSIKVDMFANINCVSIILS